MYIPMNGLSRLSKSLIQIKGPDASKFLNGLITSRLSPHIVKKKQYTLDNHQKKLHGIIDIKTNWGVMHQDIYDPEEEIFVRRDGINSMLLNSKGRVNADLFLYANPFHTFAGISKDPSYILEIDSSYKNKLLMLFKMQKLSSKVEITEQKEVHSYYYFNDDLKFDDWLNDLQDKYMVSKDPEGAIESANQLSRYLFSEKALDKVVGFAIDQRIPNFGLKILLNEDTDSTPKELFSKDFDFPVELVPEDVITERRYLNGLFEASDSAGQDTSLLPFECNLDYVNGLSLEKGCYVGQELTIRTFNTGIIRKRIMPFQFFDINGPISDQITSNDKHQLKHLNLANLSKVVVTPLEEISEAKADPTNLGSSPFGSSSPVRKRKLSMGKILSLRGNLGFILINLDDYHKHNQLFKIEIPGLDGNKTIGIKVFKPEWWPEEDEA